MNCTSISITVCRGVEQEESSEFHRQERSNESPGAPCQRLARCDLDGLTASRQGRQAFRRRRHNYGSQQRECVTACLLRFCHGCIIDTWCGQAHCGSTLHSREGAAPAASREGERVVQGHAADHVRCQDRLLTRKQSVSQVRMCQYMTPHPATPAAAATAATVHTCGA